jgi:hypothetical protein
MRPVSRCRKHGNGSEEGVLERLGIDGPDPDAGEVALPALEIGTCAGDPEVIIGRFGAELRG